MEDDLISLLLHFYIIKQLHTVYLEYIVCCSNFALYNEIMIDPIVSNTKSKSQHNVLITGNTH